MEYILGFLVLVIILAYFQINQSKKMEEERRTKRKKLNSDLNEFEGYTFTKRLVSPNGIIALDEEKKSIAVKTQFGKVNVYPYSAIHSCEILVNGQTTYEYTSVLGRSIAGGIIAGSTGAIIGGLSSKQKKAEEVSSIDFKILFKDSDETTFKYRFFDAGEITLNTQKSIKENDSIYGSELIKAKSRLEYWKDKIEVIIS